MEAPLKSTVSGNTSEFDGVIRKFINISISHMEVSGEITTITTPLMQDGKYTLVVMKNGNRNKLEILKGMVKDINLAPKIVARTPNFNTNQNINSNGNVKDTIVFDCSQNFNSDIRKINITDIIDIQSIDHMYKESDFAKEEISGLKIWIDNTNPVENIVPSGNQPRE